MPSKIKTAGTLLARGRLSEFALNVRLNLRRLRIAYHRGRPFVHHRLGFAFPCYPDIADSVDLYLHDSHDMLELSLVKAWLEPGDASIDVGANLGFYGVAAAIAGRDKGVVLAIEPSPFLSARLAQTKKLLALESVRILEIGAGPDSGETEFYVAESRDTTAEQSSRVDPNRRDKYQKITVKIDTLDRIVELHLHEGTACLVKLDIEGSEVLALGGASTLLKSADPALWIVEINLPALKRFGAGPDELLQGFPPETFEHWLVPKYPKAPGQSTAPRLLGPGERFDDATFYNLVALPKGGRWAHRTPRIRALLENS